MAQNQAVVVSFPDLGLGLRIQERWLMRSAARAVARELKKGLRKGKTPTGAAIEPPKRRRKDNPRGRPLRASGRLIKSIKGYSKKRRGRWWAVVGATGKRDDLGSGKVDMRDRNASLLAVQIYGLRSWTKRPRNPSLLDTTARLERVAGEAFERSLRRDLDRGRASLIGSSRNLGGLAGRAFARTAA